MFIQIRATNKKNRTQGSKLSQNIYIHFNVQSIFSQIRAILTKYIKIYLD